MRILATIIVITMCFVALVERVSAQDENDAPQQLQSLRTQLMDVQQREAELKYRLQELEFELKPENIERQTSGAGSTRPEVLREQRRSQLQLEKDHTLTQLDQLATRRTQLESAVAQAESAAYQQSALGTSSVRRDEPRRPDLFIKAARVISIVILSGAALGGVALLWRKRRRRAQ